MNCFIRLKFTFVFLYILAGNCICDDVVDPLAYEAAYKLNLLASNEQKKKGIIELNKAVELSFNTNSPDFINSSLGKAYQKYKVYENVANSLNSCKATEEEAGTTENYNERILNNSLYFLEASGCPELSRSIGEEDLTNLLRVNEEIRNSSITEDLLNTIEFEKDFIDQNLQDSIVSYVKFHQTFSPEALSDKQFLNDFCGGETILATKRINSRNSLSKNVTTERCDNKIKSRLLNIFELAKNNINSTTKDISPAQAQKLLNEGILRLNEKIDAINSGDYLKNIPESLKVKNRRGNHSWSYRERKKRELEKAWDAYEKEYYELLSTPAGILLQSKYLKDDEEVIGAGRNKKTKYYAGVGRKRNLSDGFTDIITGQSTQSNFKEFMLGGHRIHKHRPISDIKFIEKAIEDGKQKISEQAKSLFDTKNKLDSEFKTISTDLSKKKISEFSDRRTQELKDMFQANPGALGKLLAKNPAYGALACEISVSLAQDKDKEAFWDKVWMGAGFATGAILIATGVGSGVGAATFVGTAASLGATAAGINHDFKIHEEYKKDQANIVRALFSGTADAESIKDLEKINQEMSDRLFGWRSAAILGPLDLIGLGQSLKAMKGITRLNNFTKRLADANLEGQLANLKASFKGFSGSGRFGKFLGDFAYADELYEQKFFEALKNWDGRAESIEATFAGFKGLSNIKEGKHLALTQQLSERSPSEIPDSILGPQAVPESIIGGGEGIPSSLLDGGNTIAVDPKQIKQRHIVALQSDFRKKSNWIESDKKLDALNGRQRGELEEQLLKDKSFNRTPLKVEMVTDGFMGKSEVYLVTFEDGTKGVWKPELKLGEDLTEKVLMTNGRASILAYEIDKLMGFDLVPITVEKTIDNRKGSLQLFVDSKDGARNIVNKQGHTSKDAQELFDFLIDNRDRKLDNWIVDETGAVKSIDNDLSFTGLGNNETSFFEKRASIDRFIRSEKGQKVIDNINAINLEQLRKQTTPYISRKDADQLIRRIEFLKKYAKGVQGNERPFLNSLPRHRRVEVINRSFNEFIKDIEGLSARKQYANLTEEAKYFPAYKNLEAYSSYTAKLKKQIDLEENLAGLQNEALNTQREFNIIMDEKSHIDRLKLLSNNESLKKMNNEVLSKYQKILNELGVESRLVKSDVDGYQNLELISASNEAPSALKLYTRVAKKYKASELTFSFADNAYGRTGGFFQPGFNRVELGIDSLTKGVKGKKGYAALHELRHLITDYHAPSKGKKRIFQTRFDAQGLAGDSSLNLEGGKFTSMPNGIYDNHMTLDELNTHGSDLWELVKGNDFKNHLFYIESKVSTIRKLSDNSRKLSAHFLKLVIENKFKHIGKIKMKDRFGNAYYNVSVRDLKGRKFQMAFPAEKIDILDEMISSQTVKTSEAFLEKKASSLNHPHFKDAKTLKEMIDKLNNDYESFVNTSDLPDKSIELLAKVADEYQNTVVKPVMHQIYKEEIETLLTEVNNFSEAQFQHTDSFFDSNGNFMRPNSDEELEVLRNHAISIGRNTRLFYE